MMTSWLEPEFGENNVKLCLDWGFRDDELALLIETPCPNSLLNEPPDDEPPDPNSSMGSLLLRSSDPPCDVKMSKAFEKLRRLDMVNGFFDTAPPPTKIGSDTGPCCPDNTTLEQTRDTIRQTIQLAVPVSGILTSATLIWITIRKWIESDVS